MITRRRMLAATGRPQGPVLSWPCENSSVRRARKGIVHHKSHFLLRPYGATPVQKMSTPGMIFSSYIYRPVRVTEPTREPFAPVSVVVRPRVVAAT
jgi:hypothetical protein